MSPDGIHWNKLGTTGHAGDRSTFFYNPFRKVWVFSLRGTQYPGGGLNSRSRLYWESSEFSATGDVGWIRSGRVGARRQPRPCARGHDRRRRSSTTSIASATKA